MSDIVAVLAAFFIAFFFKEILRKFSIPRTVGEVLAGMFLTIPIFYIPLITESARTIFSLLADIGMILLFFFVGLKINISGAKRNFREAFSVSFFTTLLLFVAGIGISVFFFSLDIFSSFIVGIALAVSGVALSVDFLEEIGLLKTHVANIIVTAGAMADVIQFFLIGIILSLISSAVAKIDIFTFIFSVLFFAVVSAFFKLYIIPWALRFFAREHSESSVFAGAIMITLFFSVLAEFSGLGSLLGALIAGVIVRGALKDYAGKKGAIWEEHTLTKSIHTIGFGFLVPLVFVWAGLNLKIDSFLQEIPFIFLLAGIAFFGMIAGSIIAVRLNKGNWKEGVLVGLGMSPKGDVEIAIATLALSNGIISQNIFSAIIGMAVLTTLFAPIAFKFFLKKWGKSLSAVA